MDAISIDVLRCIMEWFWIKDGVLPRGFLFMIEQFIDVLGVHILMEWFLDVLNT